MKPNRLYKHKNNTDVAFFVFRSLFIPQKGAYKVKGSWINIVTRPFKVMGVDETITIQKSNHKDWEELV
jgi:hypothetical protein